MYPIILKLIDELFKLDSSFDMNLIKLKEAIEASIKEERFQKFWNQYMTSLPIPGVPKENPDIMSFAELFNYARKHGTPEQRYSLIKLAVTMDLTLEFIPGMGEVEGMILYAKLYHGIDYEIPKKAHKNKMLIFAYRELHKELESVSRERFEKILNLDIVKNNLHIQNNELLLSAVYVNDYVLVKKLLDNKKVVDVLVRKGKSIFKSSLKHKDLRIAYLLMKKIDKSTFVEERPYTASERADIESQYAAHAISISSDSQLSTSHAKRKTLQLASQSAATYHGRMAQKDIAKYPFLESSIEDSFSFVYQLRQTSASGHYKTQNLKRLGKYLKERADKDKYKSLVILGTATFTIIATGGWAAIPLGAGFVVKKAAKQRRRTTETISIKAMESLSHFQTIKKLADREKDSKQNAHQVREDYELLIKQIDKMMSHSAKGTSDDLSTYLKHCVKQFVHKTMTPICSDVSIVIDASSKVDERIDKIKGRVRKIIEGQEQHPERNIKNNRYAYKTLDALSYHVEELDGVVRAMQVFDSLVYLNEARLETARRCHEECVKMMKKNYKEDSRIQKLLRKSVSLASDMSCESGHEIIGSLSANITSFIMKNIAEVSVSTSVTTPLAIGSVVVSVLLDLAEEHFRDGYIKQAATENLMLFSQNESSKLTSATSRQIKSRDSFENWISHSTKYCELVYQLRDCLTSIPFLRQEKERLTELRNELVTGSDHYKLYSVELSKIVKSITALNRRVANLNIQINAELQPVQKFSRDVLSFVMACATFRSKQEVVLNREFNEADQSITQLQQALKSELETPQLSRSKKGGKI